MKIRFLQKSLFSLVRKMFLLLGTGSDNQYNYCGLYPLAGRQFDYVGDRVRRLRYRDCDHRNRHGEMKELRTRKKKKKKTEAETTENSKTAIRGKRSGKARTRKHALVIRRGCG